MNSPHPHRRRICFVTGTRAEFGLMQSTLHAIAHHPRLTLQLIATGMHLDRSRGHSIDAIRADGWRIDAQVPWSSNNRTESAQAVATGKASAAMATAFEKLRSDVVLVVGDRVEAFAAAAAGHLSGKIVAHVHGGDRALGLVDDSLRHAITKLAHIHFPATRQSAERISKLGEDERRIIRVGSPGLDDIRKTALPSSDIAREFHGLVRRQFALVVLHPQSPDPTQQHAMAHVLQRSLESGPFERFIAVYPNNDPGSDGVARAWDALDDTRWTLRKNLSRPMFLGLLREAALLIGNSSSGIIEAASFGTPVIDIGSRQLGRERGSNMAHAPVNDRAIQREIRRIWSGGKPIRFPARNIYGTGGASLKIAAALAALDPAKLGRKLIAY